MPGTLPFRRLLPKNLYLATFRPPKNRLWKAILMLKKSPKMPFSATFPPLIYPAMRVKFGLYSPCFIRLPVQRRRFSPALTVCLIRAEQGPVCVIYPVIR